MLMLRNVTSGSGATRARQTHRPDQGFNVGARRLADQLLGVGRDRLLVRQLRRGRVGLAPRAPGVQRDLLQLARLRRRDPPLVEGLDDELLRRLEVLGEGRCLSLNVAAQTAYSITSSARARSEGGISMPSCWASFALIVRYNFAGRSTGS